MQYDVTLPFRTDLSILPGDALPRFSLSVSDLCVVISCKSKVKAFIVLVARQDRGFAPGGSNGPQQRDVFASCWRSPQN